MHNPLPEPGALSRSNGGPHARPTRTTISAIVLVAVLALVTPAGAEPELEVVGTWGGDVRALFVDPASPDIAYVGSGRNLVVLDVADADDIRELGRVDVGNHVLDVKVRDGYAFVCTFWRPSYFCVVDVSDLSSPELIWVWDVPYDGITAEEVDLYGDVAYVRGGGGSVDVEAFDISDPQNPAHLARVVFSIAADCEIVGDLMYMVDKFKHIRIYDLAAPWLPVVVDNARLPLVGMTTLPGSEVTGTALTVEGDYAYATTQGGDGVLAVVNVAEPATPQVVGSYESCNAQDVAVVGGVAYLVDCGELTVLDVTAPAEPSPIGSYVPHGVLQSVHVVGTRAYVLDRGAGLIVLDVSDPATPTRLGNWHCPAVLRALDKVGDTLYVVDAVNGISILDVSEPSAPALLGSYQTADTSEEWEGNRKITVRDGIAYLAAGRGGLEVVDVRDPTHTARLDSYVSEWDLFTHGVRLDGNLLYVGTARTWGGYFYVFDVSDPESLTLVSDDLHLTGGGPEEMDIDENGLVHAVSGSGVCVLNVDDPAHPFKWDCNYDPSQPSDVVVAGPLRYVTKENWYSDGGLYIQDIRDPLDPVNIGFFHANDARSLAFRNGVVYMIAHWEGGRRLLVLDVSDPANPFLIGHAPLPSGDEVLVDGRYAYVVDNDSLGLAVIDLTGMVARGDVNCDGVVDFGDIDPLVLALSGEEAYRETLADCHWLRADCNGDGEINFDDIDAFVALLTAS